VEESFTKRHSNRSVQLHGKHSQVKYATYALFTIMAFLPYINNGIIAHTPLSPAVAIMKAILPYASKAFLPYVKLG